MVTTYSTTGSSPSATTSKPWGQGSKTGVGVARACRAGVSVDALDGEDKEGSADLRERKEIRFKKRDDPDEDMSGVELRYGIAAMLHT